MKCAPQIPQPDPASDIRPTASRALYGEDRGDGNFLCWCPGSLHRDGDRHPSLSIKDAGGGRTLIHCFVGCTNFEIIDELRARVLWP
jgi:hypothetical protein